MITTAPLPGGRQLLRAATADPAKAAAAWLRAGDHGFVGGRTAWSLAAVAGAIQGRIGRAPRILVPGWICNQSLWPLRRMGAMLRFLPVGPDGRMEWDRAKALGPVDMVVVVHTFGQAAPMAEARLFADSQGCLLVEDAAHALGPAPGIGEHGDVVLYSPHKVLAVPDGAVLVIRPGAGSWSDAIADRLATAAPGPGPLPWLARRLIQAAIPDALRPLLPQGGQVAFDGDPETVSLPPPSPPSKLARRLLAAADLVAEAGRRHLNAAALAALTPAWLPGPGAAPYRFVFRPAKAAEAYGRIRAARLPVESWPDLPPEVLADSAHAAGAVTLRRSLLLLPIHGALSPAALARAYSKVLA